MLLKKIKGDDMFKKMSYIASFFVCVLSLGFLVKGCFVPYYKKPIYPDKNLKEIKVYGGYSAMGRGNFVYSRYREYCYNETDDKEPILDKNVLVRLYDKEGHLLSKDFLRLGGKLNPISQNVISYLSYHDEGYKFHVVQLKGKKETVLYETEIYTQEELREFSYVQNHITKRDGWVYNEERECHIAAFD